MVGGWDWKAPCRVVISGKVSAPLQGQGGWQGYRVGWRLCLLVNARLLQPGANGSLMPHLGEVPQIAPLNSLTPIIYVGITGVPGAIRGGGGGGGAYGAARAGIAAASSSQG